MGKFASRARLLGLSAALAAGFALQPAVAQLSDNGRGSAVFVPYYTVNDGWRTLLNLTNTSENSLAVKVRLNEARNSRDVLDFIVLLSPHDVWTAWITQNGAGAPMLRTTDRSCTVPLQVRDSGAAGTATGYSGEFVDFTDTDGDISRASEGYIEILVMGETDGSGIPPDGDADVVDNNADPDFRGSTAWYAEHVDGEPRDCDLIQLDFVHRTAEWGGTPADDVPNAADDGSGSPLARLGSTSTIVFQGDPAGTVSDVGYEPIATEDPLKVNATLVNQDTGRAAGIESLPIEGWGFGENLVAAQTFPWFLEPSLASSGGLWTTGDIFPISAAISYAQVMNEWTNNPETGAGSDWVVTFPSKRFQADEDAGNIQAACSVWRYDGSGAGVSAGAAEVGAVWAGWAPATAPNELATLDCPDLNFPTVFQEGNDGIAELRVNYEIFDREEGTAVFEVDGPIVSPAPPPEVTIDNLRYEANVLRIGREADSLPSALDSPIALAVDTQTLNSGDTTGWLRMTFLDDVGDPVGYPVTGFIYLQREFGHPGLNFGQANSHAYTRP